MTEFDHDQLIEAVQKESGYIPVATGPDPDSTHLLVKPPNLGPTLAQLGDTIHTQQQQVGSEKDT